jgi:uncharacterized MAPEG superfamily protein
MHGPINIKKNDTEHLTVSMQQAAFLNVFTVTTVFQMLVLVADCEGTTTSRLAFIALIFFQSL